MSLADYFRRYVLRRDAARTEAAEALASIAGPDASSGAPCPACRAPSVFRAAQHRDGQPLTVYACPVYGLVWSRPS